MSKHIFGQTKIDCTFVQEIKMTSKKDSTMKTKSNKNKVDDKATKKIALGEKLAELATWVSETDKARAIIKFDTSMSTVNRYLRGEVGFVNFGEQLLSFFKGVVEKRNEAIAS